ncbi:7320_t:CDS:10 [Diversispora eburnea]|uniref:7320_t:CDS:1 n=1 Tax=Diversispora eburnea TaxID=1213867 RepID=A0A9N9A309_9GLOM|nr:7320_t:CDS:10 [Diversispora eburnea]
MLPTFNVIGGFVALEHFSFRLQRLEIGDLIVYPRSYGPIPYALIGGKVFAGEKVFARVNLRFLLFAHIIVLLFSSSSYGTPYLRNLGMRSELISLVWLAGPLSGLIVQPLIGAISDKSTFKLGRRRPFIIIGGFLVCLSMAGIAYSMEWASILLGRKPSLVKFDTNDEVRKMAIIVAVISFYCLDFSLNAVQASLRSLILDIPPLHQQETGNAWAGRMMHIGNVIGYFTGFLDLKAIFSFLGDSQVKILCIISCIVFIFALLITCLSVKEVVYEASAIEDSRAFKYLPVPIQKICNVQFFSWMGWFPFLFFSWITSVYARTHSTQEKDFFEVSTRYGSFALLIYSFVSVAAGIIIPHLTPTSYPSKNPFTIYNIYTASHIMFALVMVSTFFVNTVEQSIMLIASIGIPWAVAMWVPFTLVGEFVQQNETGVDENEFDAGMILGVHNMYIVFPQFIISIISAAIIKLVEEVTQTGGGIGNIGKNDAYGWVFRFEDPTINVSPPEGGEEFIEINPEQLKELGRLGEGAGGTVTKVLNLSTNTLMAKKKINVDPDPNIHRQILRELQFLRTCNSPNIVSYYGAFLEDDNSSISICMEFCEGGSLDSIYKNISKRQGRIGESILGKIGESVLNGLVYLYSRKIIHRDIKPSNILVTRKGEIKICDFGVSGDLVLSWANTFLGTSYYMAVSADVWSLGLTIMEVAQNRFPFPSVAPIELVAHIANLPAPELSDEYEWSDDLRDFLKVCLEKNGEIRPTPKQMLDHPLGMG